MMEFGAQTVSDDLVKDGSEATFMDDVVEASRNVPVIVDFWAPWCGPCKQLGPALEAAVQKAGGKVKMVKIDVDQNQMLASQMRVQSIPAVFAFVDGQPVDGFMGAKTPAELDEFIAKLGGEADDGGLAAALAEAEMMLEEGALADAMEVFAAIYAQEPDNMAALSGLVRAQLKAGNLDQAQGLLAAAPLPDAPELVAAKAAVDLAVAAEGAGEVGELQAKVAAKPDDLAARFDLAMALAAKGDQASAIDELLEIFRRDRDWNEEAAKTQLFKIFDSLGAKDPLAQTGRRRLSSLIFS